MVTRAPDAGGITSKAVRAVCYSALGRISQDVSELEGQLNFLCLIGSRGA